MDIRCCPLFPGVGGADGFGEGVGLVSVDKVDGTSRPARPGQFPSEKSRGRFGRLDQRIERGGTVLEIVSA